MLRRQLASSRRHYATKPSPKTKGNGATEENQLALLPRYLRRQALYGQKSVSPPSKGKGKEETPDTKRLLDPYTLSLRLKSLCDAGKLEEAVKKLRSMPLDAQNTATWNTLIWECLKDKKYNLAYDNFTDMKRRGFSPNVRTYQTMFSGLSRIDQWQYHTKQLAHARKLYEYLQRHLDSVRKEDPNSKELSVDPINSYIKILGDAGDRQGVFDVYNALPSSGKLAPNQFTFTAIFNAIARPASNDEVDYKLLWKETLRAAERPKYGFDIDGHLVTAAINAMSYGSTTEQALAIQLARDYFGLAKPGDALNSGALDKLPLTSPSLAAALSLCNRAHKPSLCLHYFEQTLKRPEKIGGPEIVDRAHMHQVLEAHVAISALGARGRGHPYHTVQTLEWMVKQELVGVQGPKIRPVKSTFDLALMSCWRGADWKAASRTFELMSGYMASDFIQDGKTPRLRATKDRSILPDAETMSCLLRAALADPGAESENILQCLRMISFIGTDHLFVKLETSKRQAKHAIFYQHKLASVLLDASKRLSKSTRWRTLFERAKAVLNRPVQDGVTTLPPLEVDIEPKSGDDFIEYQTIQRPSIISQISSKYRGNF